MIVVTRSCAPKTGMVANDECKTTEVADSYVAFCHCSEDGCNAAMTLRSGFLIIYALFTTLFTFK